MTEYQNKSYTSTKGTNMPKLKLDDVKGLEAFNRYASEFPDPSPAFDAKLLELYNRFGINAQIDHSFGARERKTAARSMVLYP